MVSRAEMEAYVKETIAGQEYLLESRLQQAKDFVEQLDLKTALVNTKAEQLRTEVDNAHERLAGVVTEMNKIKTVIEGKFDGIQVDIKSEWDRRQAEVDIAFVQIKEAFDEIRAAAGAELAEIKAAAGVEFAQVAQTGKDSIEALRNHIEFWATGFEKKMERKVGSGDFGRGERPESSKGMRMDKKEVQVWKLADKVEKTDFRHWLDAIDVQLEAVHQFKYPELILKRVRMCEEEITDDVHNEIRELVNKDLPREVVVNAMDWDFEEKTRFMFTYLLGKLNTELHGKSIGVKSRNGLELYRIVNQSVDALPLNAKFYLDCQLTTFAKGVPRS